ncbi:MAG TPA: GNAT family N-acetyltransferase [Ilumatobacteraceae bacterium]|jgi:GNAT superfamily N-acetyltransferase|nr:GNAT family N-acetyltransferase [Ilumatobacteraceae bacterium]
MTFSVRRLEPQDHELLRAIRLRALSLEPHSFGSTFERESAFTEDTWRNRLRPAGNPHFARFDDSGQPIGLVAGMLDEEDHQIGGLVGMWVDQHARGTGTADALVTAIVEWAMAQGCVAVRLKVTDGNARAERMYHRNGFEHTGRTFIRGRDGFPEIEMERQLQG